MSAEYEELESLVENGKSEAPLQRFLEAHPEVIEDTFDSGSYFTTVFPQFSLAGEYVPDFVMIGHRSNWMWNVDLIEIEPSVLEKPLFNKAKQAAGRLRDAEGQVDKWKAWMGGYKDSIFVPKALEKLKQRRAWDERPEFYHLSEGNRQTIDVWYRIIIGRRQHFEGWGNKYRDLRYAQHVEIVPWDRLLERLKFRLEISSKAIDA